MNAQELKKLTGEKTKNGAIASINERLCARKWMSGGKEFYISGIDCKTLEVHLVSITSLIDSGASIDRCVFPLDYLIDCVSGNF